MNASTLQSQQGQPTPRDAYKFVSFGCPPDRCKESCGKDPARMFADECNPRGRLVAVESASTLFNLPLADADIAKSLSGPFQPFGSLPQTAPAGAASQTNTLGAANLLPSNTIIQGISVRVLTNAEGRTIRGNFFTTPGANLPGSPTAFTLNDLNNNLFGLGAGTGPVRALLLHGLAAWKAAYAFEQAWQLAWLMNNDEAIIKRTLRQWARIEPFAEAEAAGFAFDSNQDRARVLNDKLDAIFGANARLFEPITHKRNGSFNTTAGVAATNISTFNPTNDENASPTVFGGVGVAQNLLQRDPLIFDKPIFWPSGRTFQLQFSVFDPVWLAEFHRWMSVTGGSNGIAGSDLNLPLSATLSGLAPATALVGANLFAELTNDAAPILVSQQINTNIAILKTGNLVIELAMVGKRVGDAWLPFVAQALDDGWMIAPAGAGDAGPFRKRSMMAA